MDEHAIGVVSEAIDACLSSSRCFQKAAENVGDQRWRTLCSYFASQRKEFAKDLRMELERAGQRPKIVHRHGHRGCETSRGCSDLGFLETCEQSEKKAREIYREAINSIFSIVLQPVLRFHLHQITQAYEALKGFQNFLQERELEPAHR